MADPLVVQAVRQHRQALLQRETAQMAQMARRWAQVERELQAAMDALALQIEALREAGEVVNPGKVYRLERYSRLLFEVRRETAQYADYAASAVTAGQQQAAWIAQEEAQRTIALAAQRTAAPALVRLAPETVSGMVGIMGDGTPLRRYLEGVYGDAARGMTDYLTRAVAQGLNPRQTARQMQRGLRIGLDRALTIARTEQLRVYRESQRLTYEASGVVGFYRRLAAHSRRTCLGCLLEDGRVYPISEPFEDHVQGRCSSVPLLPGEELPQWETGTQWLERQTPDVQRHIMGPGRLQLWQSGQVPLEQMSKHTYDPLWGGAWVPKPISEMVGGAAAGTHAG